MTQKIFDATLSRQGNFYTDGYHEIPSRFVDTINKGKAENQIHLRLYNGNYGYGKQLHVRKHKKGFNYTTSQKRFNKNTFEGILPYCLINPIDINNNLSDNEIRTLTVKL